MIFLRLQITYVVSDLEELECGRGERIIEILVEKGQKVCRLYASSLSLIS